LKKIQLHEYLKSAYHKFNDSDFRIVDLDLKDNSLEFLFIKNTYFQLKGYGRGIYSINENGLELFDKRGYLKPTSKRLLTDNFITAKKNNDGKRYSIGEKNIPDFVKSAVNVIKKPEKACKMNFSERDFYRAVVAKASRMYPEIRKYLFHYADYCLTHNIRLF